MVEDLGQDRVRIARELLQDVLVAYWEGELTAAEALSELSAFVAQTKRLVRRAYTRSSGWLATPAARKYATVLRRSLSVLPSSFTGLNGSFAKQLRGATHEAQQLIERCTVCRLINRVLRRATEIAEVPTNDDSQSVTIAPAHYRHVVESLRAVGGALPSANTGPFSSAEIIRLSNNARRLLLHLPTFNRLNRLDSDLIIAIGQLRQLRTIADKIAPEAEVPVKLLPDSRDVPDRPSQARTRGHPHRVFISYNHSDERWMKLIQTHLEVSANIEPWSDHAIAGGDDVREAIFRALNSCDAAMILLSAPALRSPFITQEEVPRILNKRRNQGIPVIPVLLRPCMWKHVPWLSGLLIRPGFASPLAMMRPPAKAEQAVVAIADELLHLLESRSAMT